MDERERELKNELSSISLQIISVAFFLQERENMTTGVS